MRAETVHEDIGQRPKNGSGPAERSKVANKPSNAVLAVS